MFFPHFFINLIRLLFTLTLLGAIGTLVLTMQLADDPHAAVTAYHSIGVMAEHVLAGCVCCLAGSVITSKITACLHDGAQT